MNGYVLMRRKLQAYVLIKVLKYCTGSSVKSYQCKFAVKQALGNKRIETIEEVGAAIKKIIHYNTIRGKFSSIHPDLAAEGITRVEVGEEGLHFIRSNPASQYPSFTQACCHQFLSSGKDTVQKEMLDEPSVNEKGEDDVLLKMALEEHSRREEDILARDLESTMLWHV